MDALKFSVRGIIKELNAYLSGRMFRTDIRTVHLLRVALKKFRAALWLSGRITGRELRLPESVKALFRAAGGLRDIQVERQWLQGLSQDRKRRFGGMILQLKREENARRRRLRLALSRVDKEEWKRCCTDLEAVAGGLDAKRVKKWINKRYAVTVVRGRKRHGRRALHAWRRKSKRVYYQALLASAPAQHPLAAGPVSALHAALQLAGDWHDSVVARKHLRQARERLSPGRQDAMEDVEKTLIRTEKRLLKRTHKAIAALPAADLIIT